MKRAAYALVLWAAGTVSAATPLNNDAALAASWGRTLAELADCGANPTLVNMASLSALADYLPMLERAPAGERLARLAAYRDAVRHAYDTAAQTKVSADKCRAVVREVTRRIEASNHKVERLSGAPAAADVRAPLP